MTGRIFVDHAFSTGAKDEAVAMVTNIRNEFEASLKTLPWIDPQTIKSAHDKAEDVRTP